VAEDAIADTWSAERWSRFLEGTLDCPVEVVFGRSRRVPIRTRRGTRGARELLTVRLHGMFADAPHDVARALAEWMRDGRDARGAGRRLDDWIEAQLATAPDPPRRPTPVEPAGATYDLEELARALFAREFAGDFRAPRERPGLTWGRRARSRSRHSLCLGSYVPEEHLVRLHPVLDQPAVPRWFVRYVLFHEVLHAALPPRPGAGPRWVHHGPEFRRRESRYPDFARAVAWEQANLPRMIACARRGTPMRPRHAHGVVRRVLSAVQHELFATG